MSEADSKNNGDYGSSNSSRGEDVTVSITGQDMNVQFKGSSQSVLKSTVDFFVKQFPEIDVARKMSLNYDTNYLIGKYSGLIKISPEEVQVLVQPDISMDVMEEPLNESGSIDDKVMAAESEINNEIKWSIKASIALQFVASRIAKGRGIIQDEDMKISDIMSATRANSKK